MLLLNKTLIRISKALELDVGNIEKNRSCISYYSQCRCCVINAGL